MKLINNILRWLDLYNRKQVEDAIIENLNKFISTIEISDENLGQYIDDLHSIINYKEK